ncbi:hypothetical protein HCTV-8_gp112 [Haloarcula virus HCTV-8]|uniref:Uncharacterized protein n=3 Tax=Haloferacalesvirus hv5 TaxID=1273753 RepID=A0AAE9BX44_9CAUD|nr:hypothetical protein HCTV-7_gp116 [Haloarcula phage HCTV-7]UBF20557.1 hypothetical protein HCTV-9_gp116 [Haloarcula phage HCTV-9]UBF20673.1 hypothetical protein HCTV-11_gp116 [Haloarcula phage HCTV-11]UBF20786.1 hypothetical protein HRTV-9_gp113 [Halorubrum virus HRTV-9]UBF20899.1 hypothetical protein HRTV-16_gp113 [Halorubrum virus HRTV-16]UBF21011.1 hypothetical protein HCTV-8_gp112 [Haloarcula virus HCTV-8]UBF21123.1 hypothetical protein HCTV-10_gp112 [Haloarcula virus HCTV-10]
MGGLVLPLRKVALSDTQRTMSVKVNSDGDFVENTVTTLGANHVSDLYDLLQKDDHSVMSLAHEVRKAFGEDSVKKGGESEIAKWCEAPREVHIIEPTDANDSDGSIGRAFWKATDYTANDYNQFTGKYDSLKEENGGFGVKPLAEADEFQRELLLSQEIIEASDTVMVPINSDGEPIVPVVASKGRQEATEGFEVGAVPTYEEAKARLETLLSDYFGEVEVDETAESSEKNNGGSDSGSDTEEGLGLPGELFDPTEVKGIGNKYGKALLQHIVENQISLDWEDYEEHVELPEPEVPDVSEMSQREKDALLQQLLENSE